MHNVDLQITWLHLNSEENIGLKREILPKFYVSTKLSLYKANTYILNVKQNLTYFGQISWNANVF